MPLNKLLSVKWLAQLRRILFYFVVLLGYLTEETCKGGLPNRRRKVCKDFFINKLSEGPWFWKKF